MWSRHFFERGNRLLRIEFLIETNYGVEHDDGENGDAIHDLAEKPRDETGDDEDPNDNVLELTEKDRQEIQWIYRFAAPIPGEVMTDASSEFLRWVRMVVQEAIENCGGRIDSSAL